jgi:NAD(P)-dependent dehydrogenase (short-subunit alcohol dehydrogenase family)
VENIDDASLTEMFRANVFSMYFCSREAVRRMSTRLGGHGGSIVNMSSVASRLGGLAGGTAYAATKGAIDTFSLALAKEVGAEGIRVNTLRPGLIETEIHEVHGGVNPDLGKLVPMGRWGTADEVARVALWVASDEASYVHAAIIDVSGGR